jgi:alkyl sulfatase BDS1-like metallo-beta-lactamase superfamily hydrolase
MVVGSDGVIIIDPGENDTSCEAAMRDLRRFSDLPVRAVIYTNRHPDHCFAFKGCGVEQDVAVARST